VEPHPVQLTVGGDLERSRLTVFFRGILVIPHFIWLLIWTIGIFFTSIVSWVVTLITRRPPVILFNFACSYIRYGAHVYSYLSMLCDPYPKFGGRPNEYPIDIVLPAERSEQSRWRTLFRLVLAIPSLVIAAALGGGGSASYTGGGRGRGSFNSYSVNSGALLSTVGVLGWFTGVFRARMPKGLRDAGAFSIGYTAQMLAYVLFVTDRYPFADPGTMLAGVEPPPVHPVHTVDEDDLRRSHVTVFFRLLLAIPHLVWLTLWAVAFIFSVFANWFVTLFRGTPAGPLHRFNSRFVRYELHVYAFLMLVSNPFPGFTGLPASYPLDLVLPAPARQNRWKTGFRFVLAVPALMIGGALGLSLYGTAVLTWFVGLFRGTAPEGLHRLAVYALRYLAQTNAYLYLLTDEYPHASPVEGAEPAPALEPAAEPQYAW
jgi:Domain of unknown function (DUF4389)